MNNQSILVIDDSFANQFQVSNLLKKAGYSVYQAADSNSAFGLIAGNIPALILLDINMPDIDGYEVCKKLKSKPETEDIPVIFITARSDTKDIVRGFELGAVDYVTKPFNKRELLARVETHLELKNARIRLEELLHQRESLTNMIVHDMNNLVGAAMPTIGMILEDEEIPETCRSDLELVNTVCRNLHQMMRGLIDVEKLESGTENIVIMKINLSEVIHERLKLYENTIKEKNLTVLLPPSGKNTYVMASQFFLMRIIDNLLHNAVKFSPPGGNIAVTVSSNGGCISFTVSNSGLPVPAELQERIFEKFTQDKSRQDPRSRGVGLGLAFCKMALKALGGTITVTSPSEKDGTGVAFCCTLSSPEK